jgi:hypothetical protein
MLRKAAYSLEILKLAAYLLKGHPVDSTCSALRAN